MEGVGIVKTEHITLDGEMTLECGKKLGPITVAYETYGNLNAARDNAVLVCHALSGDAHAAGKHSADDAKTGWWDSMIGPDKPLDTNRFFVICSNFLGGCSGTTGTNSTNPKTGKPYGLDFPIVTVGDMVKVQRELIRHLKVEKLHAVIGGSLGGFQVLEWAVSYPSAVKLAVVCASSAYLSAQALAFNAVGRNAITGDPGWMGGNYYGTKGPERGLAVARMIGHITYLSSASMDRKFGRRLTPARHSFSEGGSDGGLGFDFTHDFEIESYLHHQGQKFVDRFDANTYLYTTKAMDYFDLTKKYGSLKTAFKNVEASFLVTSYSHDWLFPSHQSKEIVQALIANNKTVTYCELTADYGHDAFLLDQTKLPKVISNFLKNPGTDHVFCLPCSAGGQGDLSPMHSENPGTDHVFCDLSPMRSETP